MNDASIPLSAPDITDSEIEAVVSVLKGSRLSLGPALKEFESSIATYAGCAHAVAVNSGTSALHLALLASRHRRGRRSHCPVFYFYRRCQRNSTCSSDSRVRGHRAAHTESEPRVR